MLEVVRKPAPACVRRVHRDEDADPAVQANRSPKEFDLVIAVTVVITVTVTVTAAVTVVIADPHLLQACLNGEDLLRHCAQDSLLQPVELVKATPRSDLACRR